MPERADHADASSSIFISYAHADSFFVDRLEAYLRQQGFDLWVDRGQLAGGQRWRRELQEAVERCQVLLIVLSPDAVASQNVQIEYDHALHLGKVVIPVYYRQCNVPMELRAIQWIDFRQSYEQGIGALVQALHRQQKQISPTAASVAPGLLPSQQPGSSSRPESEPTAQWSAEGPWNVPFGRNPFFTGRGPLLARLHELLSHSQSAALNQSYALSGLGGIGKTQTAIEYAYRYREGYSAVFWVRAASRETLVADYVAIARLLGLSSRDSQDQMLIIAAVKRWFEQHKSWLLILDNADELSLLTDFLPTRDQGYLLLTTRAQATGKIARSLSVEKMDRSEGMQLLLRRAKLLDLEETLDSVSAVVLKAAQQLVEELDGLPLALDQAGAYIEETGCSVYEYLELYGRNHLALLQQQSNVSVEYPHTVASTWALSFSKVEQQGPAAADLLRLCAFLHPDAIPEATLTGGAAELGPVLSPVAADPLLLNGAIQLLRRYSLVKRDPDAKLLNMHRLVQVVLQESLNQEAQRQWAERSVRAVSRAFPEVEFASWVRCELCLPQAKACGDLIERYSFTFPEAAHLLHQAGCYLRDRGQYGQAKPHLHRALTIREQVLGPEHPETARTLNELAQIYWYDGKYEQAESLCLRALTIQEQVLGSNDPNVADSLNTLGLLYIYQSKYEQAEPLLQRALAIIDGQTPDPGPLVIASVLNNLAFLYSFQGKYAQCEPLYKRALAIHEQIAPEHPYISITLGNLSAIYYYQGKYEQAEPLLKRGLAISEQTQGPTHPDVAQSLYDLAVLYRTIGKHEQAESLFQRALLIREQVLGPKHPDVAASLNDLAVLYDYQGKHEQAESLFQRALLIREQVLGPEHIGTTASLNDLAHLYTNQGKYEQAEPFYQRALAIREQILGSAHPRVAQSLHGLAELYQIQGKYEQAQPLYQRALTIREQALGPGHLDTLATREALTRLLQVLQEQQGLTSLPKSVPPA